MMMMMINDDDDAILINQIEINHAPIILLTTFSDEFSHMNMCRLLDFNYTLSPVVKTTRSQDWCR